MLLMSENFKVCGIIVLLVPILMMNDFIVSEFSSDLLFNYRSMLFLILPSSIDDAIVGRVHSSSPGIRKPLS